MSKSAAIAAAVEDTAVEKEVTLISADGEEFKVPQNILKLSRVISEMLHDEDADDEGGESIPLPNVNGTELVRVIEYCTKYAEEPMTEFVKPLQDSDLGILVQPWYADFIESKSNSEVLRLTLAANYLDIRPLLDLNCARIASFIKGKTPEEIRTNLGIVVDFTHEEEAQIRAENAWADDLY